MTENEKRNAARRFSEEWRGRGYEKGETSLFWISLLRNVLGVERPEEIITFEERVKLDNQNFIDAVIHPTKVLIEQKSLGKDLRKPIRQSDGSYLTPIQQARRYTAELNRSEQPRWIVTSNFERFLVYDEEHKHLPPEEILLADLPRDYYRLSFLTDTGNVHTKREMEVSMEAGEIVGRLYDALLAQYIDPAAPGTLHSLNVLCVRLVFCLYAEDAGVFGRHSLFHDYLARYEPRRMRGALIALFRVLNTPVERRDPYEEDELLRMFPYCNGGLFADEGIEVPLFTDEIAELLLKNASDDFDWSEISPTIFGAVFESTLNPETRRAGGMHYTSIENIHKVIDPLFLDDLQAELDAIQAVGVVRTRNARLLAFQERLASLRFLDPACGSGNFLTETYLSLRRLENQVISLLYGEETLLGGLHNPIRVTIGQFYGIELNDFAVTVATTALWIAEAQMLAETERIVRMDLNFLPLKSYTNITEGNALRIDWETVCPKEKLSYIMGNPPFVGARLMVAEQKDDVNFIFGKAWKNTGNLDYVCCWYKKAADLMKGTAVRAALVSTNSICQGEQPAILWRPLTEEGVHIDFAYHTFRWDSEASLKAHVHCVIVGFSCAPNAAARRLFLSDQVMHECQNINGYLLPAGEIYVESRKKPLCEVPEIGIGNKPIDDGNYLFTAEERDDFIRLEPASARYFKPWYGSYEFINQKPRYCLWLGDCPPNELRAMPHCLQRVQAVKEFRLRSKSEGTRKIADKPTRFHVENMPDTTFIIVPKVSSEKRKYIPMGFMSADTLGSDLVFIIPSATPYHFGVLTSNVHMAWMRAVCGRLKSDYRYSKDIVYNNFPWPSPTPEQQARIEATAQAVLDARALYPDSSLADLYDDLTMPPELRTAHQANDRAVMAAYGFPVRDFSEADCVARLLEMYRELTR